VIWYKNHLTSSCAAIISDSENALDTLVRMLAFMDRNNKQINPMAIFEMQRYFPDAYNTFREQLMTKDVAMLREYIEQGMDEGLFRKDIDADLMARYRLETSLMILQPNLLVNNRSELMSVALEIGEHFLYGIMTPKGEKLYHKYKEKYIKQASKV